MKNLTPTKVPAWKRDLTRSLEYSNHKEEKFVLDIVIPTRNRPDKFIEVLETLILNLMSLEIYTFRLNVSDNSDFSERTKTKFEVSRVIEKYPNIAIQLWETPEIFKSAEEHLAWLYQANFAKYVWFLGDDDVPTKSGLATLNSLIRSHDDVDFFLFNCKFENNYEICTPSYFPSTVESFESDIITIIQRFGYWSAVCGITNQILRSEMLSSSLLSKIITDYGTIYSHMTHHVIQFRNKKLFYAKEPIAIHHLNSLNTGDASDWKRHARNNLQPLYDPWLLSFARQLDYLIKEGYVPENFINDIFDLEVGLFSRPFVIPLGSRIAWFAEQYKWEKKLHPKSKKYLKQEEEWLRAFLINCLPEYTLTWIKCFSDNVKTTKPINYMLDPFRGYWKMNYFGFDIYQLPNGLTLGTDYTLRKSLPYLLADLSQRCPKHTYLSTSIVEIQKLIKDAFEITEPCKCFPFNQVIYSNENVRELKLSKILKKVYRYLPRKTQTYLKDLLSK